MRLICPWCGERDAGEFTYKGDATAKRPPIDNTSIKDHANYVYDRKNIAGDHREMWQHTGGCRAHVEVLRNTLTHDVKSHKPMGPFKEALGKGAGK